MVRDCNSGADRFVRHVGDLGKERGEAFIGFVDNLLILYGELLGERSLRGFGLFDGDFQPG